MELAVADDRTLDLPLPTSADCDDAARLGVGLLWIGNWNIPCCLKVRLDT